MRADAHVNSQFLTVSFLISNQSYFYTHMQFFLLVMSCKYILLFHNVRSFVTSRWLTDYSSRREYLHVLVSVRAVTSFAQIKMHRNKIF